MLLPLEVAVEEGVEDQFELVLVQAVFVDVVALRFGDLFAGLVDWVDGDAEEVFKHAGNQSLEGGGSQLQAGVGVDLQQPRLEGTVDDKIESEQLKSISLPLRVDFPVGSHNCSGGYLLHFLIKLLDFVLLFGMVVVKVPLELTVGNLVAVLVLAVVIVVDLNGVVGEVDEEVCEVVEVEDLRTRAQIAFVVPEELGDACNGQHEDVGSYVEFASLVEEDVRDVSLDDVGMDGFLAGKFALDLLCVFGNEDAVASIAVFPWLHNPDSVLDVLGPQAEVFESFGVDAFYEEGQRDDGVDIFSLVFEVSGEIFKESIFVP